MRWLLAFFIPTLLWADIRLLGSDGSRAIVFRDKTKDTVFYRTCDLPENATSRKNRNCASSKGNEFARPYSAYLKNLGLALKIPERFNHPKGLVMATMEREEWVRAGGEDSEEINKAIRALADREETILPLLEAGNEQDALKGTELYRTFFLAFHKLEYDGRSSTMWYASEGETFGDAYMLCKSMKTTLPIFAVFTGTAHPFSAHSPAAYEERRERICKPSWGRALLGKQAWANGEGYRLSVTLGIPWDGTESAYQAGIAHQPSSTDEKLVVICMF